MDRGRRKYTDEQLARAVANCCTMREILVFLGMAPYGGNYETVRRRISELGLPVPNSRGRDKAIAARSDEEVAEAVRTSRSLAQALAKLGARGGGSQALLRKRIQQLGLETSHLLGEAWRRGVTTPVTPARPLEEYLVEGRLVHTSGLKRRLFREGLKEKRCENCHRETWNGRPIPLELDHINGRRDDNRLANLRVLCPNCHAQTDTYRGRNIGAEYPDVARVPERQTEAS